LGIPVDFFALTDLQYIILGREGDRARDGQYLSDPTRVVHGQDNACVLSTSIVDIGYNA
jgi:hypothetical protein